MNFINKLKIKGKNLPLILIAFCVFGFIPKFSYAIGVTDIALTFAIVAFPFAIEWLFWILADKVAAPILNLVVTHLINGTSFTVTRDLIVLNLWSVARDWANLLIVVGLIGVAIATILNLEKYKAQKLLAPLLIVALLVNFSVLFVGLIIDSSNIIMNNFFGNSAGGAREIVSSVVRVERIYVSSFYAEFIDTPLTTNSYTHLFLAHLGVGILGLVARIIEMAAIYFLLAVSFIYLAIVLVARYAMLVFLFIISPIAFVFMVFPIEVCQKVWKSWWEHFIRWCFIGVGLGFSLRLSVDMFNALSRFRISQTTIGEMELRIFVVTMILAVGVYTTLKSAPAVAKAAMGIVKTAGLAIATGGTALAGKVGLGAGKMVGYGTGLDRATDNLKRGFYNAKDYANRGLENIGLARRGTMAANRKARETKSIEGDVKLMQNLSETNLADITTKKGRVAGFGPEVYNYNDNQRAAAAEVLRQRGKLKMVGAGLAAPQQLQAQREVLETARLNGQNTADYVSQMSAETQADIINNPDSQQFGAISRAAALRGLAANGQINNRALISQDQVIDAMEESRTETGSDLKDIISSLRGEDMGYMVANNEFDGQIRGRLTKALADKRQLDLIRQAGDTIVMRRNRLIDAIEEAADNGVLPQDIVRNVGTDDQAYIVNTNKLTPEARGTATESLRKKGELNRIEQTLRETTAYQEALEYGGANIEELEKGDHRAASLNDPRLQRIMEQRGFTPTIATATIQSARAGDVAAIATLQQIQKAAQDEVLDENIGSYTGAQLQDINPIDLARTNRTPRADDRAYQRVRKFTPEKILKFHNAPQAVRDAIRSNYLELDDHMTAEMNAAHTARTATPPDQAQAAYHTGEAGKLRGLRAAIDRLPK